LESRRLAVQVRVPPWRLTPESQARDSRDIKDRRKGTDTGFFLSRLFLSSLFCFFGAQASNVGPK